MFFTIGNKYCMTKKFIKAFGKICKFGSKALMFSNEGVSPIPPEIELPANTLRFRFENTDYNPTVIENGGTWTKVADSSYNDWDWYCADTAWDYKFVNMETEEGLLTEDHKVSIIATGDMSNIRSLYVFGDGSSIYGMFLNCTGLTSIHANSFNDVTYAPYMFYGCTSLTGIPNNSFNSVYDATHMFMYCTSLTGIPNNSFNSVYDATHMFMYCTSLTGIPNNSFNNVTNAYAMFLDCTSLTGIPNNSFNNVTNAYAMFLDCTSLTSIPDISFNNVTDTESMFNGCTNVEHGALALYNKLVDGGKVQSHGYTFWECGQNTLTGLEELQQIPEDWGGLGLVKDTNDNPSVKGKWIGTTPLTDLNLPQMKVVIDINDENVTIYRNTGFGIDDGTKFAYKYGIGNMFSGSDILKSDDDEYITIFWGYPLTYNTTYAENFYQYNYKTSTATYTLEGNRLKVIISGTMNNTDNDDIVETVMYFDKVNDDSIQLFEELSDIIPKFEITKFIGIDTNFNITYYYPVFFLETNLSDYIVELSTNLPGSNNVNKPASVMCHNMLYWTYKLDDGEWNSIVRITNYDTNIPYKSQKYAIMINGSDSKALVNVFDGNEHTITIGLRYGPTNSVLPITASVTFNKATSSITNGDIPDDVGKPVVNGNVVY